jgi:hypothetical protein
MEEKQQAAAVTDAAEMESGRVRKVALVACAAGKGTEAFELDYWSPDRLGKR